MSIRSAAGRFKRRLNRAVFGPTDESSLNTELAAMEHIFRTPPMTPALLAAINLISPHYKNVSAAKLQVAWQADQNAACWSEYLALAPILETLPSPKRILEIGPGMVIGGLVSLTDRRYRVGVPGRRRAPSATADASA